MDFETLNDFEKWLAASGISTVKWGEGQTKTVQHLWQEWLNGEFAFQNDPPMRLINVLQLQVQRDGQQLVEAEQELTNGERRFRNQLPSEKMKRGEDYLAAALRCCYEELGVEAQEVVLLPQTYYQWEETAESPSYPGLITHYIFHAVQAVIAGLPTTDFWCDNHAHTAGDPVKRHRWAWKPY